MFAYVIIADESSSEQSTWSAISEHASIISLPELTVLIRTPDTKEKPFTCSCGACFTRQDLLARHYKISQHDPGPHTEAVTPGTEAVAYNATGESDVADSTPMPSFSVDNWPNIPYQTSLPLQDLSNHPELTQTPDQDFLLPVTGSSEQSYLMCIADYH